MIRVRITLGFLWICSCAPLAAAERPNILLIIADDLAYSDLGSFGGEIPTPNLDLLASQGIRFTQYYVNAVCVPTRASLYTGLYPEQALARLESDQIEETLANALTKVGYRTSLSGKWHLGSTDPNRPIDRGFEEYYGLLDGASNYFDPSIRDPYFYNGGQSRVFAHNKEVLRDFPSDFYTTDAFADHAIAMIRKFSSGDRPFFVNLAFTAPHFPLQATEADIEAVLGMYDEYGGHVDRYLTLRERRYERLIALGIIPPKWRLSPRDEKGGSWRWDYDIDEWLRRQEPTRELRRMEIYAAMIVSMDRAIGRVLNALDSAGVADNTIVIFMSDNGGSATVPTQEQQIGMTAYNNRALPGSVSTYEFLGPAWGWAVNAPFRRHKSWVHEGGISSPLIVYWPGMEPNIGVDDALLHVLDIPPTILDLAGADIPANWLGHSLKAVFQHSTAARPRERSLFWDIQGNKAVRMGRWKAILANGYADWELYDMRSDRTETEDVAARRPEVVGALVDAWEAWKKREQDAIASIKD